MINAFIPKEDNDLPDSYKMKISYIDGKQEEYDIAQQFPVKDNILTFWSKEDICHWICLHNVKNIIYDKNFSKVVAIYEKKNGNKNDK